MHASFAFRPPFQKAAKMQGTDSKEAGPPFDKATADVVIRSSDNIHFRVHTLILSMVSDFFSAMFTLPQSDQFETWKGLPVVTVEEDSRAIELLLLTLYPACSPSLNKLADVHAVLKAAMKYQMDALVPRIKEALVATQHLEASPVAVFAIAYSQGLEEEAVKAARATLRLPMRDLYLTRTSELGLIPAEAFQRLLEYHDECGRVVNRLFPGADFTPWLPWAVKTQYIFFVCTNNKCFGKVLPNFFTNGHAVYAKDWWSGFMEDAASVLREEPRSTALTDHSFLEKYILKAMKCEQCRLAAAAELWRFSSVLVEKIEDDISKVRLGIRFSG